MLLFMESSVIFVDIVLKVNEVLNELEFHSGSLQPVLPLAQFTASTSTGSVHSQYFTKFTASTSLSSQPVLHWLSSQPVLHWLSLQPVFHWQFTASTPTDSVYIQYFHWLSLQPVFHWLSLQPVLPLTQFTASTSTDSVYSQYFHWLSLQPVLH